MRPAHLYSSLLLSVLALLAAVPAGGAEKPDRRLERFAISADSQGSIDLAKPGAEFIGNVLLSRDSLLLTAHKVLVWENPAGFHMASASALEGGQVQFRQGRERPGELVEGQADRIEYDGQTEIVRFIGGAKVRALQGSAVTNELSGAEIYYNGRSEQLSLRPGDNSPAPNGRVRVTMMPSAASAAASSPPATLQPSTTLQTAPRKPS
jgi:lipopolysaccharide export system protein LptA